MCISSKRLCAVLAIFCLIFSASLAPAYADDSQGADMYLYLGYPTVDPYANMPPYAVPQYKFTPSFSNTFTSATDVYLGVASSTFPSLTTSGTQPTVYWSYYAQAITGTSTTVPNWTGLKTPTGYAYYIDGTRSAITATVINNAIIGGQGRQIILRTTLPHNTVRFLFSSADTTNGVGFKAVSGGSYDFGFGYAFVVTAGDDALAKLDEIITLLTSMDAELDTQTEILNQVILYLNSMDQLLNDIGQNVFGIYDILKNALGDESIAVSDDAMALGEQMLQKEDSERYWNDKSDAAFEDLGLQDFSFGSDLTSALSRVGQWFGTLWTQVTHAGVIQIWTFPLILGISLAVIGRLSRSGGQSKGGDKKGGEKKGG